MDHAIQPAGNWEAAFYAAQKLTAQTVKSSPGVVGGWFIYNPNSSVAYVQIFNISGAVTLGTSTPLISIGIPAESGANVEFTKGIEFDTAIKLAATTTATGSSAPSTGLDVNIFYK